MLIGIIIVMALGLIKVLLDRADAEVRADQMEKKAKALGDEILNLNLRRDAHH